MKTVICVTAILFAILSCSNDGSNPSDNFDASSSSFETISSSSEIQSSSSFEASGMPVMDSRVVAYKKGMSEQLDSLFTESADTDWEITEDKTFTANKDILKIIFPDIFNNERPECSYFAVFFSGPSVTENYWILQNMVLYQIWPSDAYPGGVTEDVILDMMLVCDDTAEGDLKEKIILNPISSYIDPDWNSSESVCGRRVECLKFQEQR